MKPLADYSVIRITSSFIYLIDLDGKKSITNDAEAICAEVVHCHGCKRIAYRDSQGEWGELIHENGRFATFAPLKVDIRNFEDKPDPDAKMDFNNFKDEEDGSMKF